MNDEPQSGTGALYRSASMNPVSTLMRREVVTCPPDTPLAEAAALMAQHQCGSVIVSQDGRPIGIWTESDAVALDLFAQGIFDQPVSGVMSAPLVSVNGMVDLQTAAGKFREHNIRHLVVVDDSGAMTGMVSQTDVVLQLGIHFYLSLREVGSIIFRSALMLPHDLGVGEAVARLRQRGGDGALVVEDGQPVGIVTERDVVRLVAERRRDITIGELASRPLVSIAVDAPLLAARDLLDQRRLRHLVVIGGKGEVLGLLSMADILAALEHGYVHHLEEVLNTSTRRLAATEQQLKLILRSAGDGMVGLDAEGVVTFANAAAAKLSGWSEDALVGQHWHTLIGHSLPDGRPCAPADCQAMAACRGGPEARLDGHIYTRRDGTTFPVAIVATPLVEGSHHSGAVLLFHDIGERLAAQRAIGERAELYRQMFERHKAVKLLIDPADGAIVDANEAAASFYGYPRDDLKMLRLAEIDVAAPMAVRKGLEEAKAERRVFFQASHRTADGSVRDVEVYAGPVAVNRRTYVHAIVTDVTDRKNFQAELEKMAERLARSNADLQQFAYVASHDLQEPLRTVVSYLQLIEATYGDLLDDEGREFIGYAVDGGRRMQRLIRDLLEYSRLETRAKPFATVALSRAVEAALADLAVAIKDADAEVKVIEPLPEVQGDEGQLIRLFENLIGNAVKYRHQDRKPEITIRAHQAGETWVLSVSDNGIGIDKRFFERIFMIFQRLHAHGEYEGSGIGLTICKRIVERHAGTLWVESEPGRGSTFRFTLPI